MLIAGAKKDATIILSSLSSFVDAPAHVTNIFAGMGLYQQVILESTSQI